MNLADYLCSKLPERENPHELGIISQAQSARIARNALLQECKQALQLRINREKLLELIRNTGAPLGLPLSLSEAIRDKLADNFQEWITE